MKKQLRIKLQFAGLLLLGILGKASQGNAQAFDFRSETSPAGNFSSMLVTIGRFQQNCIGSIGAMNNMPVNFSVNNTPNGTEVIPTIFQYASSSSPVCSSQTPGCGGSGPLSYLTTSVVTVYTLTSKVNVSASGLTNINAKLYPGTGYGNYQAANISGTYSVQPETFHAVQIGMVNKLPFFVTDKSIIFATVNQPVLYSCTANDVDGDSLVYHLRPVSPAATYAPGFSYQNPITASPALALNSRTGQITFTPTHFDQAAGIGAAANTYIVGIDVDEYRKINGQSTKIGTIQRNLVVNVIGSTNNTPVLTAFRNGTTLTQNTIIDVLPGTPVTLDFTATDANATDIVDITTNIPSMLPGFGFTTTSGQNPKSGQLTWTPTAADTRQEPYFFSVTAKDNACPYTASTTTTYGIRVKNVTGTKNDISETAGFYAYPNPYREKFMFRLNAGHITYSEIVIRNVLGQVIDRIKLTNEHREEINWANAGIFPAGQYTAQLIGEGRNSIQIKFIKLP